MRTGEGPIEYPLHIEVDGESFAVKQDRRQAGAYHYDWLSGANTGYGFSSRFAALDESSGQVSHDHQPTLDEQVDDIREFLGQVDPVTGYIEDE